MVPKGHVLTFEPKSKRMDLDISSIEWQACENAVEPLWLDGYGWLPQFLGRTERGVFNPAEWCGLSKL